jgi:hypothetical protein
MRSSLLAVIVVATFTGSGSACGTVQPDDPPLPIAVRGETESGQTAPTWLWEAPVTAIEQRVRLVALHGNEPEVEVAATAVPATATRWTSSLPLEAGVYRFEVTARDGDKAWFAAGSFTTTVVRHGDGVWSGVRRELRATPLGRRVLVSCQTCFRADAGSSADNLAATLTAIHAAQGDGADAIGLVVTAQQGVWHVDGRDGVHATGAPLASVLADEPLRSGDQLLVLDVDETTPTDADIRALIELVRPYAGNGRPVILRAGAEVRNAALEMPTSLVLVAGLVTPETEPFLAPYLRLHVRLPEWTDLKALYAMVNDVGNRGWHGVAFDHHSANVFGPISFAREHGIAVGVDQVATRVHCAALRDAVDLIGSSDGGAGRCAAVVARTPSLVHLDVAEQREKTRVDYHVGTEPRSFDGSGVGELPVYHFDNVGEDRYGGSLYFRDAKNHHLDTVDADADGYLVAVVFNTDEPTIAVPASGETVRSIISKRAGASGFALEQFQPAGAATTASQLRFRVFVGGKAYAATMAAPGLNHTDSVFVVGSYDGSGAVHLWVDGVEGTPSADVSGPVTRNDVPISLGTEPGAIATTRWIGLIQRAVVTSWPTP